MSCGLAKALWKLSLQKTEQKATHIQNPEEA